MSNLHWRIIFIVILSLPFIDILTMLTERSPVSFGALFRTFIIAILFFYVLRFFLQTKKHYLIILLLTLTTVSITFIHNFINKQPFYFYDELQFLLKTIYLLMIIFYLLAVSDSIGSKQPDHYNYGRFYLTSNLNGSFVSLLYWIAVISGTSLTSYPNEKAGYSGWYFAANELSVIIVILFAFSLHQLMKTQSWQTVLLPFLLLCISPMVGTKTAFFGVSFIALLFLIFYLRKMNVKVILYAIPLSVFYFVFLFNSAIMYNLQPERFYPDDKKLLIEQQSQSSALLSSRDTYVEKIKQDFSNAPFSRKLFGLGYAGDYKTEPKTAEMDFYELFFSYGIIGTILMLIPMILLIKKLLTRTPSELYILFMFTLFLCFGVAFFVGHVLFAPAVMSYVAMLVIGLLIEKNRVNYES